VDVDQEKLRKLENGEIPFFEPGLDTMVTRNCPDRLTFTSKLAEAIDGAQIVFVAVGTPPQEDGSADLSHVLKVAEDVACMTKHDVVLVLKSTVPVGTNAKVKSVVEKYTKHRVSVVSNPEFLKEGDAISDFLKPDRVVIGTLDDRAFELLSRLYAPFNRQRNRLIRMSPKSAEIVKYAANALLATKISFMNEVARLCDAAGGDVEDVRIALGADQRIGYEFLYPGLGFGGSCFPKDLRALVRTGQELGLTMNVAEATVRANELPVDDMYRHIQEALGSLSGKIVAVWGLAFKPKTDDVREAPAIALIDKLVRAGARVRATDPRALHTSAARFSAMGLSDSVQLSDDAYEICRDADALVLATEWSQYRAPDTARLKSLMKGTNVFDGRNILIEAELEEAGLVYRGIGRPAPKG
jgi:UDPglucose 6-dehydrogenase